jgi:hypothetical protein
MMPYAGSPKEMNSPAFLHKMNKGPVAMVTMMPSGPPSMARNLVQWFSTA